MKDISYNKKMAVIKLLIQGYSYSEVHTQTNVSIGSISNIWAELKAGMFPEVCSITEDLDSLRELAVQVHQTKLSPTQSSIGLAVVARLGQLGLEPNEIEKCHTLVQALAPAGSDPKAFVAAAVKLQEIKEHTGLDYEQIMAKAQDAEEKAKTHDILVQQIAQRKKEKAEVESSVKNLTAEQQNLTAKNEALKKEVLGREAREAELTKRVVELEDRAYKADKELAEAKDDLAKLNKIGLSTPELTKFTGEVREVAHKHGIAPQALMNRLMAEMERLGQGHYP